MLGLWLNITTHKMILLPYRFCGDKHHAFAFPFVLIFLPLRLSCKESSTSNQAFLLRRKDVTALRCSEPLRSKVGGPSKVFAMLCGMGPPGNSSLQFIVYSYFCTNLLITCRFFVIFLVVSRKKRNFGCKS